MNRWLIPFLVTGVVSTIALFSWSPLALSIKATVDSPAVITRTESSVPPQPHALPSKTPQPPQAVSPFISQPLVVTAAVSALCPQPLAQELTNPICSGGPAAAVMGQPRLATAHTPGTGQPHDETSALPAAALATLINQQRQHYGLPPLAIVPTLTMAAYQHSLDMATQSSPAHQGSDGSSGGSRMLAAGYPWQAWAEVIGWGFADPASMVAWWLNDAEHRAVLLSPAFTDLGVGYVTRNHTQWQTYWTVNVGRPMATYLSREQGATPTATVGHMSPLPRQNAGEPPLAQPQASPMPTTAVAGCPTLSIQSYPLIPMEGRDLTHPAPVHGDLNLDQRGYRPVTAQGQLMDLVGPVDPDAPQLSQLFDGAAAVHLKSLYQVADWQWQCSDHGCRGEFLTTPEVTMMGLETQPGMKLYAPARQASLYRDPAGNDYVAVVLYAETNRLTLAYTRDGSVANGYVVHLEQVCVDPRLLQRYREADHAGRQQLPALQHHQPLGTAAGDEVKVAMRDHGTFLDPRSRKDWWRGY